MKKIASVSTLLGLSAFLLPLSSCGGFHSFPFRYGEYYITGSQGVVPALLEFDSSTVCYVEEKQEEALPLIWDVPLNDDPPIEFARLRFVGCLFEELEGLFEPYFEGNIRWIYEDEHEGVDLVIASTIDEIDDNGFFAMRFTFSTFRVGKESFDRFTVDFRLR